MRRITAIAALGALAGAPAAASSDTLGATLGLSATVSAGCTGIAQSSPFSFPAPLIQGTQPVVPGVVSTTCASSVPAIISFNSASSVSGVPYLSNNAATNPTTLAYGLYKATSSGAVTITSGSVVNGTAVAVGSTGAISTGGGISVNGTGGAQLSTVYAALTAKVPSDTPSGTYTDALSVTLTF